MKTYVFINKKTFENENKFNEAHRDKHLETKDLEVLSEKGKT